MRHYIPSQSSFFLFMGAIGALLGPTIILHGYPFPGDNASQDFMAQPEFLTFLLLVAAYTSILATLFYPLWSSLRFLKSYGNERKLELVLESTMILLPTLFFFSAPNLLGKFFPEIFQVPVDSDIEQLTIKIHVLIVLGAITLLPAAFGMVSIPKIARLDLKNSPNYIVCIKKYLYYRELIQRYLYSLGTIIGLITLIAGALRTVRLAVGANPDEYRLIVIITFGLYWSAVLALYYAVGYLSLLDCGRNLQDSIYPLNSRESLVTDTEKHKKLGEILQLDIAADRVFRNSIAIFAPLLSGLMSHLLPTS